VLPLTKQDHSLLNVLESKSTEMFWADRQYLHKVILHARSLRPYAQKHNILKFFADSIIHPTHRAEWFDYLENRLPLSVPSENVRHLVEHSTRSYMRRWFSPQEKIDNFRCHYDMLGERFSPVALRQMREYPGLLLGELIGKSGRHYKVTLHHAMTKEGEIDFCFTDVDLNLELMKIRGTFGREANGRRVFWVGTIQGPRPPLGREEIAHATRDLSVLRPKQTVLHAACAFCAWMGVDTLFLPPRKNHISYRWWRVWRSEGKISSDYERFWEEFTTQKTRRGDYRLSLPLPRRKLEDVQPKRRKDWVRRHAHLDALAESIGAALEASRRR
jgi:uncharacterized protein VirK/YbjX